jgi:hypothetical protein
MAEPDRLVKMEIDYSSVVDQKLKECEELMKVNQITNSSIFITN